MAQADKAEATRRHGRRMALGATLMALTALTPAPGHADAADVGGDAVTERCLSLRWHKASDRDGAALRAVEVAHAYRKGHLTREQALSWLEDLLTDYTGGDSDLQTVKRFVHKNSDLKDCTVGVAANQAGWSGRDVYWVAEARRPNKKALFVKVFRSDMSHVLQQLWGLDFMREATGIAAPRLQALGKYYRDGVCHFMVAETAAPGTSMLDYLRAVGTQREWTREREEALRTLLNGCRQCGRSLAAWHRGSAEVMAPLSEAMETLLRRSYAQAHDALLRRGGAVPDLEKLSRYVEWCLARMATEKHLLGAMHGKVKAAHTYYQVRQPIVTLTDSRALLYSYNEEIQPIGLPVADVFQFTRSLTLNSVGYSLDEEGRVQRQPLLNKREQAMAVGAFLNGYREVGGFLPSQSEEEFLLLRHNLQMIANSSRTLPEPENSRLQDLVAISIDDLKRQLAAFD